MNKLFTYDDFLSNLAKINCYTANKIFTESDLLKLKKPFFISLSLKKKIKFKKYKGLKFSYFSMLVILSMNKIKKISLIENCRAINLKNKQECQQILEFSKLKNNFSRLYSDPFIKKKIIKSLKKNWILNYLKKRRGEELSIYKLKNNILGFAMLLKENKNYRIDLIEVKKRFAKRKVGSSLINYIFNKYIQKNKNKLIAGTQSNNKIALKFYSSLGFKIFTHKYYYHFHSV